MKKTRYVAVLKRGQGFKRENPDKSDRPPNRNPNRQHGQGPMAKKSKQEEFDLLSQSKVFKVVFDNYTPRAHFMIFPKADVKLNGTDYSGLKDCSKQELVEVATAFKDKYNLKGARILSIHRGKWIDKKDEFHAHICSEADEYIHVFRQKIQEKTKWPEGCRARELSPERYEERVRKYPVTSWFCNDVKSIEEMIEKKEKMQETSKTSLNKSIKENPKKKEKEQETPKKLVTNDGYTILFHTSKPRVGFVRQKTESQCDAVQTLEAMNKFAKEKGMTVRGKKGEERKKGDDDKGCHLCLFLSEPKQQEQLGFMIDKNQKLCGYIQTSAPKFYGSLCPENKKDEWYQQFQDREKLYKVYT